MKYLLFFSFLIASCSHYKEIYIIEKTPINCKEILVIPSNHYHSIVNNDWICIYNKPDTVEYIGFDTITTFRYYKVRK